MTVLMGLKASHGVILELRVVRGRGVLVLTRSGTSQRLCGTEVRYEQGSGVREDRGGEGSLASRWFQAPFYLGIPPIR